MQDGEIIAAAQEERFTRKKHDHRFPERAIAYCLQEAGIEPEQLDAVAFYDKPWVKFERLLETYLAFAPAGIRSFLKSMPLWLKEKLWMGELIANKTGFRGELIYPEHHQSHAASAFFPSPYQRAAILTVDGVGEWATATWGVGEGNRIRLEAELRFPHSLGLLYTAFTYYTGFKVNSGEYKVMGLAPYGEPRYVDLILSELMDLKEDGSFRLNQRYFNYCQGLTMTSEAFHELFGGPPRVPESEITQREMDLARSVQEVCEEVMLRMARHVKKQTGERYLVMAGGVALNCVANGKILRSGLFEDLWIQPAAGDAGGALGAALFAAHQLHDLPRRADGVRDAMKGAYLGPSWSGDEIEAWLRQRGPDAAHAQPQDQVPGVLPALRPELPGGGCGRVLRAGPPLALHADRRSRTPGAPPPDERARAFPVRHRQAQRAALGHPRGHARGLLRPCADGGQPRSLPLSSPDRSVQGENRLRRGRKHLVQRSRRADRLQPRGRLPVFHADGDGRAGVGGLSFGEGGPGGS